MAARPRIALALFIGAGLVVAVLLAFIVGPFASSQPDGLEKVATEHRFIDTAGQSAVAGSPLADYATAGVESERLSVGVAGVIGVVVTFAVGGLLFLLMKQLGRRGATAQGRAGDRGATAAT